MYRRYKPNWILLFASFLTLSASRGLAEVNSEPAQAEPSQAEFSQEKGHDVNQSHLPEEDVEVSGFGFSLDIFRRNFKSQLDGMDEKSGQQLVFFPRVVVPMGASWSISGGYYVGKSRMTGLNGDLGELHRLDGPSLGGTYKYTLGSWNLEASAYLDLLRLRVDVDVNSKTTEYAQGTRRYSGKMGLGSRLMLACYYRMTELLALGINFGFGTYEGTGQFDNMDLDHEVSFSAKGLFAGISLAFVVP